MAQYYRARGEISLFQADTAPIPRDQVLGSPLVDDLELGDIYIFPHPSSAPPSPSQFSDLSPATDFSYHGFSEPRSRDRSPGSECRLSLEPLYASGDVDNETWAWSASPMVEPRSTQLAQQREQWEEVLWRGVSRRNLHLSPCQPRSQSQTTRCSPTPHPRIHIPLLSYFMTLFSIDDETLHLLHHTSNQSTLFPGMRVIDVTHVGDDDESQLHHRVSKLLQSVHGDATQSMLKKGLAVSYDSPPASYNVPFSGLFSLVSSLVSNGGKALREVFIRLFIIAAHLDCPTLMPMPLPLSELSSIVLAVHTCVRATHALRKVPVKNRTKFALDIAFLCLSVRTGYLVDAFAVPDACNVLTSLLGPLQDILPIFHSLSIIYEPLSGQVFIVNTRLLYRRVVWCLGNSTDEVPHEGFMGIDFVSVGSSSACMCSMMPMDVRQTLEFIATNIDASKPGGTVTALRLPDSQPSTMIPLAAIILEYPVAYVPSTPMPSTGFLNGLTLDIYECLIHASGSSELHEHTLLKFSCPCGLTGSPTNMKQKLEDHFRDRVFASLEGVSIEVKHIHETLDRVAL